MRDLIKHLWLIISLILGASLILVFSDLEQRNAHKQSQSSEHPLIAIMQIASTPLLDQHVAGVISRLQEKGFIAADKENIRLYNPQGDFSTANAIARDIVNGPYEMIITSSTLALQTIAKANTESRKTHVFGAVTDPYSAGVGIKGPKPEQHPEYMAGVGTFQPVKEAIRLARGMNPELKRLGVVWNPGEQCSEACVLKAREICKKLGISLVEANAANTSEVSEATRSILAKGIDALWIGGDTVANASIRLIINLTREYRIPVFSNDPGDADKNALFGLGANYFTVGQYTADIAADILNGRNPASIPVKNLVPNRLGFNAKVLNNLKDKWAVTPAIKNLLAKQENN